MIVPQFWAESRLRHRDRNRQLTVRRFGWSDTSQADAQVRADERAHDALARILAGERLFHRDLKVPYNGADGLPIREEIVSRHGETVITRNSYGARCLNTPDVLFADVDFAERPSMRVTLAVFALLLLGAVGLGLATHSRGVGIAAGVLSLFAAGRVAGGLFSFGRRLDGGPQKAALQRVHGFLASHPDWSLRLYRTPAGLRIVATHRPFRPDEPAVAEFFEALGTDPVYAAMCRHQQCFRARVSAKPWRIGIQEHLRPRPGVWPVAPERLPARRAWIEAYEAKAAHYAACAFMEDLGSAPVHPAVGEVLALHDDMASARRGLPIA